MQLWKNFLRCKLGPNECRHERRCFAAVEELSTPQATLLVLICRRAEVVLPSQDCCDAGFLTQESPAGAVLVLIVFHLFCHLVALGTPVNQHINNLRGQVGQSLLAGWSFLGAGRLPTRPTGTAQVVPRLPSPPVPGCILGPSHRSPSNPRCSPDPPHAVLGGCDRYVDPFCATRDRKRQPGFYPWPPPVGHRVPPEWLVGLGVE